MHQSCFGKPDNFLPWKYHASNTLSSFEIPCRPAGGDVQCNSQNNPLQHHVAFFVAK